MTRAIPIVVWGALFVVGVLIAYLMALVPPGYRGALAAILLLTMTLGPLVAHVVTQTVRYKTAQIEHKPASRPTPRVVERAGLRVVQGREQGGQHRL